MGSSLGEAGQLALHELVKWLVEVKSMTGTLNDRPVGMSHTQFEYAREKGDTFWLYAVEHATDPARARVLRIQNPVGRTRTFRYDRGWTEIAESVLADSSDSAI